MSEELIKVLKIQKKPGGLLVRIPNDVVKRINLTGKEKVKVYLDEEKKRIIYELI
jgi:antitoxin component of MazEF toxin-antitoxin module